MMTKEIGKEFCQGIQIQKCWLMSRLWASWLPWRSTQMRRLGPACAKHSSVSSSAGNAHALASLNPYAAWKCPCSEVTWDHGVGSERVTNNASTHALESSWQALGGRFSSRWWNLAEDGDTIFFLKIMASFGLFIFRTKYEVISCTLWFKLWLFWLVRFGSQGSGLAQASRLSELQTH